MAETAIAASPTGVTPRMYRVNIIENAPKYNNGVARAARHSPDS